jgi:hypothetical protein
MLLPCQEQLTIVQEARLRGSLYHYFLNDKQQWVTDALFADAKNFSTNCESTIAKASTVAQGIARTFKIVGKGKTKARNYQSGYSLGSVVVDLNDNSEALRVIGPDIMAKWQQQLAGHFAPPPTIQALALAKMVIACFEGVLMRPRLERSSTPLRLALEQISLLLDRRLTSKARSR